MCELELETLPNRTHSLCLFLPTYRSWSFLLRVTYYGYFINTMMHLSISISLSLSIARLSLCQDYPKWGNLNSTASSPQLLDLREATITPSDPGKHLSKPSASTKDLEGWIQPSEVIKVGLGAGSVVRFPQEAGWEEGRVKGSKRRKSPYGTKWKSGMDIYTLPNVK